METIYVSTSGKMCQSLKHAFNKAHLIFIFYWKQEVRVFASSEHKLETLKEFIPSVRPVDLKTEYSVVITFILFIAC